MVLAEDVYDALLALGFWVAQLGVEEGDCGDGCCQVLCEYCVEHFDEYGHVGFGAKDAV